MIKKFIKLRLAQEFELICRTMRRVNAYLKTVTSVSHSVHFHSDEGRSEAAMAATQSLKKRSRAMSPATMIGYVILVSMTASTIAGCSLEMAATNPAGNSGRFANTQPGGGSSEVGSLQLNVDSLNQESIISPGDQIEITVWGYPEFNTTTTVKSYGTITIPLIGKVIAGGLTVQQFQEQLKQRLSVYVKGNVRLTISHIGVGRPISVLGAVNNQGNYPALKDLSLVGIIADAGGTATDADLSHIKIFRRGIHSDVINVNLSEYLESGNIRYVPRVGPGDMVFVPEQPDFIKAFSVYASEVVFLFGFFTLLR